MQFPDVELEELESLAHAIEHAAHYLPAQGPITVFIHHNTLHAFEELPFFEGVERGSSLFGCQPYLSEDRYRQELQTGRIQPVDIAAALLEDLGDRADELIGFLGTRFHFRQAMLQYPLQSAPAAELRWFVAETDALKRFRQDAPPEIRRRFLEETRHWILRDHRNGQLALGQGMAIDKQERGTHALLADLIDHYGRSTIDQWSEARWERFSLQALWRLCREGVHRVKLPPHPAKPLMRHRDLLLAATGEDTDILVHEVLVRLCAAFLDQGLSRWPLPDRECGLWAAFCALYRQSSAPSSPWLHKLPAELAALADSRLTPLGIVHQSLAALGVPQAQQEEFLTATLLALRGWGGMIRQIELRGDRVPQPIPAGSLVEFLAVRLVLEQLAVAHVAQTAAGYTGPLADLRRVLSPRISHPEADAIDLRAFQVFQLAQVLGWLPPMLAQLSPREWTMLVTEIEAFPPLLRRRVLHAAYERRYRNRSLDAICCQSGQPSDRVQGLSFQVVCCLDEREESLRRHLEEVAPGVETFGAAGFYNVPMYYRGAADAHYVPLCPIVVRPQHWVAEQVSDEYESSHDRRTRTRRLLGAASHGLHLGSRSFAGGALLATGLGALASVPLVARVLFPRLTARVHDWFSSLVRPPDDTCLTLQRTHSPPGPHEGCQGFTLDEMTGMSERLLRDIGLVSNFAPLVVILGHGSSSLNNPHNSAYNCGACGGSCGGPNARAMASLLNDPRVRANLLARGIAIPHGTWFIGGWHNTCNDSVAYSDLTVLPVELEQPFAEVRQLIDKACERNAHERCRRFVSAPLNMAPSQARRHVEARAEDLAQTRPECGHASNALCIVARRSRTRGLYMDRRAFLTTYDPTQDDADGTILTRLLQAAVPVCGGINLEYYFSYIDNAGYGCGTKLPHNVSALLGVMDGHASDLRTGLPWQMVEIHEPMRLLFVVETTPAVMSKILDRNPGIGQLCRNGWVQLATLDPHSPEVHLLQGGRFELYRPETTQLPRVESSLAWYRGWRDHLPYATINSKSAG